MVLGSVRAGNHGFSVPGDYDMYPQYRVSSIGGTYHKKCDAFRFLYMNRSCALTQWNGSIIPRPDVRSNYAMLPAFNCFLASSIEACTAAGAGPPGIERPSTQALRLMAS